MGTNSRQLSCLLFVPIGIRSRDADRPRPLDQTAAFSCLASRSNSAALS
jgi:hypothetical protein